MEEAYKRTKEYEVLISDPSNFSTTKQKKRKRTPWQMKWSFWLRCSWSKGTTASERQEESLKSWGNRHRSELYLSFWLEETREYGMYFVWVSDVLLFMISNRKSMCESNGRLAERALRFLLDPFVETRDVIVMHALDLGYLLAFSNFVETDSTTFIAQVTNNLPLNTILIGPRVLLPEKPLVANPEHHVWEVVEKRVVYGLAEEGIQLQFRMHAGVQPLQLLHDGEH